MSEIEEKLNNIVLIPCSGSEYHGELARQAAIQLAENSDISMLSSMSCTSILLKNVLLQKQNMVDITKNHLMNSFVVIINGCYTACASQIYEQLGIKPDLLISVQDIIPKQHINLNDINTFKNKKKLSDIEEEDVNKVVDHVLSKLKEHGLKLDELVL